ncbi:MAG: hypothetical protein J6Q13_02085 [Clostridia bacterium]|nr:hypothetical protein [Clostridia bacterium]
MKEVKRVTEEMEQLAYKNVEDFNFIDMCPKFIFELLNDAGVFVKVFNEVTSLIVERNEQIELKTFKYIVVEGEDDKYYPAIDLIVEPHDCKRNYSVEFCLTLTPFSASLDNASKDAGVYGGCDKQLTKIWRIVLKGLNGVEWVNAFKKYYADVKCLKESKIATQAEIEYNKIEQQYENEINSI